MLSSLFVIFFLAFVALCWYMPLVPSYLLQLLLLLLKKKEEEEEAMLFMGWSYLASVPITCSVYYYILILNRNCH